MKNNYNNGSQTTDGNTLKVKSRLIVENSYVKI